MSLFVLDMKKKEAARQRESERVKEKVGMRRRMRELESKRVRDRVREDERGRGGD